MSEFRVGDEVKLKNGGNIYKKTKEATVCAVIGDRLIIDALAGDFPQSVFELSDRAFTKSDLKDGMRVELRNGNKRVVFNETTYCIEQGVAAKIGASLSQYRDDLTWIASFSGGYPDNDIIRVTDRDGTVLFEREAEKRKVTLELTDEQIKSIKEQGLL